MRHIPVGSECVLSAPRSIHTTQHRRQTSAKPFQRDEWTRHTLSSVCARRRHISAPSTSDANNRHTQKTPVVPTSRKYATQLLVFCVPCRTGDLFAVVVVVVLVNVSVCAFFGNGEVYHTFGSWSRKHLRPGLARLGGPLATSFDHVYR